jgi:hypothetical protein
MAVGDLFTAANFRVTITELSGGTSPFTGKGIAELILPGKLPLDVNVSFEGAYINDCYQLRAATKFITDYDPEWGNVVSIDTVFKNLREIFRLFKDPNHAYDVNKFSYDEILLNISDNQSDTITLQTAYVQLQILKDYWATEPIFPQEVHDYYIQKIDSVLSVFPAWAIPAGAVGQSTNRNAKTNCCSVSDLKIYAKEVSTALINPWGYLISKGGKCLLGAGIDLAFQYLITGMLENGNINVFGWSPRPIIDKFDYYDASISCFDAVVDTEGGLTGAAQTFLINIPIQAKREYDKVKDVTKMDWKTVLLSAGKEAIIELATSLAGNAITHAKQRIDLYVSKGKCARGKLRDLMTSMGFSESFATKIFGTAACFTKNTKINTIKGYKPIIDIKVGDLVLRDHLHILGTKQKAYAI